MKDKLIKTNRKASYYYFRKFIASFAFVLGLAAIVAIPVTIKLTAEQNKLEAETPKDEPVVIEEIPATLYTFTK